MVTKYGKKKHTQKNVLYTTLTAILLFVVFISMGAYFYSKAQAEAYENLHAQTKQIKDNVILQLESDRENLSTMASLAAERYKNGESYAPMFAAFKPIGLIANIGILNPDNTFVTKAGTIDLSGKISFEEEKEKGAYISGRVADLTRTNDDIIRTAVPINVNGYTVGILYGVIKPEVIGERYNEMAQEFDAQLFIYDKDSGNLIVDTVHKDLGNISFLKERKYVDGSSYEQMMTTEKGFASFESAYKDENLYLHYSAIDEFDWVIAMGRYDSQVFGETHELFLTLFVVFLIMLCIISVYIIILMVNERTTSAVVACASDVRKELLETVGGQDNIKEALAEVCRFAKSRSAIFFDSDGELYHYISPKYEGVKLSGDERKRLKQELFRYAAEYSRISGKTVNVLCIKTNRTLLKNNPAFYSFLVENRIREISFSATVTKANHIVILASVNSKRGAEVRMLAEKVSACFSMALYNKNHLSETTLAATTDSLTGVLNRVAYKSDMPAFDEERPMNFSCIYIDVNELHLRNNKFGHAAGDEMLIFIANTLKDVFYGHKIYRMGGDEFLVFCQNLRQDAVKKSVELFQESLKTRHYHVAVGISYRAQNVHTEEMVKEAEVRMYEAKAAYYQNKEQGSMRQTQEKEYVQVKTGILEIDTMLSILKEKYNGIYRVSLSTDKARRILMPAYLGYNENEENFSSLFSKYVLDTVDPDYHRAVMNFLNYEVLKQQLMEGNIPQITYKKIGGEFVILSVYKLCCEGELISDTLWVFAKE